MAEVGMPSRETGEGVALMGGSSDPTCDLCGSQRSHLVARQGGFAVVRCDRCGHLYTSPRPSVEELEEYYRSGEFRARYESSGHRNPGDSAEWHVWAEHHRFVRLRAVFRAIPPPASVLEVGCGYGDLLATLAIHGYRVWGIEPDRSAAAFAAGLVGEERISTAPIERFPGQEEFDLVLAFSVLEHVPSPTAFVREVTRLVKPEGRLFLHVPNGEYLLLRTRLRGSAAWLLPVHLHHFSPGSLERLLARGGFDVAGGFWHEYPYLPRERGPMARWRSAALSKVKHALWAGTGRRLNLSTTIAVVARKGR